MSQRWPIASSSTFLAPARKLFPPCHFPGWRSAPSLRLSLRLLDKLISCWPFLLAPLMQRVPNDPELSEVLKSQIPTDTIRVQYWDWLCDQSSGVPLIYTRLTAQEHLLMCRNPSLAKSETTEVRQMIQLCAKVLDVWWLFLAHYLVKQKNSPMS